VHVHARLPPHASRPRLPGLAVAACLFPACALYAQPDAVDDERNAAYLARGVCPALLPLGESAPKGVRRWRLRAAGSRHLRQHRQGTMLNAGTAARRAAHMDVGGRPRRASPGWKMRVQPKPLDEQSKQPPAVAARLRPLPNPEGRGSSGHFRNQMLLMYSHILKTL